MVSYIFIAMDSRKYSEQIKQRIVRHNRLMKMIGNYRMTQDEIKHLKKIKNNTMMEINMRYLRCQHNRKYKFPLKQQDSEEQDQETADPLLSKKQNTVYDLNSQNSLKPSRSPSKRSISLESSRKVISLQLDRNQWQRQKLLRLDLKAKNNFSSKNLTKKNSFSEKTKVKGSASRFRLPELKIDKYRQNLKTEARTPEDEKELESVISKKLITESCEGHKKMNGVEKYLQKIDPKAIKTKVQRFRINQ